eukprot:2363738-Pyramimonas_sp.AAC.1
MCIRDRDRVGAQRTREELHRSVPALRHLPRPLQQLLRARVPPQHLPGLALEGPVPQRAAASAEAA